MSIPFTCPHCGLYTEVDAQYAGQSGPCYGCGKTITVPPPTWSTPQAASVGAYGLGADVSNGVSQTPGAVRSKSGPSLGLTLTIVASVAAAIISILGVGAWFLGPAVSKGQGIFGRGQCASNLERIALAIREYRAEHGAFPPAYVTDARGKRMHSWRVMILPQLGFQHLYDKYDFDKPWDSPENRSLLLRMPEVFACPTDAEARDNGETNYLAIVGRNTILRRNKGVREIEVTDGLASTVMLAESAETQIQWTEPTDLDFASMSKELNLGGSDAIGSLHKGGAHVATADGKVHFLEDQISPETVEAMATANGGEAIPPESWNR